MASRLPASTDTRTGPAPGATASPGAGDGSPDPERTPRSGRGAPAPRRRTKVLALPEARWALASLVAFLLALPLDLLGAPWWLWGPLYAVTYATGGWEPGLEGLKALREKTLDVDLLMVVAALGAASLGQFLDGALLIVIFATSGALEALATTRTADSVRGLLDLAPATATRVAADGREETVPSAQLAVGDVVLVRPGERIGADGEVIDGGSEVDQATITGEPLPVAKEPGDEVFAGTLNANGALWVRVTRDPSESVVARIVRMVEEASRTKAPTQLFIEKVEQRYSLGMVVATLALFLVPLALGDELRPTLLRAMTFMIVASPCAVVLATMPPLLSAMANAGRHGVLVKSAVAMERLAQVDAVALDKTGTLSTGVPEVTDVRAVSQLPVPGGELGTAGDALTEDQVLTLAAAAEAPSEHPLARAVVAAARARGLALPEARDFAATPGLGVRATVGGVRVEVGAPARLLTGEGASPDVRVAGAQVERPTTAGELSAEAERAITTEELSSGSERATATAELSPATEPTTTARQLAAALEADGRTAIVVLRDGEPVGVLGLADRPRSDAALAVRQLTALTGTAPVLLSGDNAGAATHLAGEVGIGAGQVRAGLLPEEKVRAVGELEAVGRKVLMVGDGVNDAPALAAAHCGIAMGRAGSDLALETADAVTVRDELAAVPTVLALSRRARRLVVQNLVIAGVFIGALVVWDLTGTLPLPLGVAGHEGSTVLVGLNGLRLLADGAWRRAGAEGEAGTAGGAEGGRTTDRAEQEAAAGA